MKPGLRRHRHPTLRAALFVAVAGLSMPGTAPGAPPNPPVAQAIRRVRVERVWAEPGMASDDRNGMRICTAVEAVGMKWSPPLVEFRLRTPDGKLVRAAADAPDTYTDEKGLFSMQMRLPVVGETFEWPELSVALPHETALNLPRGRPQTLIATVEASLAGLSSTSESEITVPPGRDVGQKRAIGLLAVDPFPNSSPPREKDTDSTEGETRTAPDAPAPEELGLKVWGYVEAVGLNGSMMVARLSLRRASGEPILRRDPQTGATSVLESRVQQKVAPHEIQFFLHFVPYRELNLEPGRHRLILRYSASCEGLTATVEELCAVPVGRHQPRTRTDDSSTIHNFPGSGSSDRTVNNRWMTERTRRLSSRARRNTIMPEY